MTRHPSPPIHFLHALLPLLGFAALLSILGTTTAQELDLSELLGDQPKPEKNHFVVHEWGSVNLIQGSDQAIIGGLVDDQSDLPDFVQVWQDAPKQDLPMIIEKPIIYFYTKKPIMANVTVRCPKGILTQWWPKVHSFHPPPPGPFGGPAPDLLNGRIEWNFVSLLPDNHEPNFKPAPKDSWWPTARDTDATPLRVRDAEEKFLFYRGISAFNPAIRGTITPKGLDVSLTAEKPAAHVFTTHIPTNGDPTFRYAPTCSAESPFAETAAPIANANAAAAKLQSVLTEAGLYEKEAAGLVNIWREAMFETPGSRLLYLMDTADLDAMLPLTVKPTPDETKRVMLVRLELITPEREKAIMDLIRGLGAPAFKDRVHAQAELMKQGRAGQALMRKTLKETDDPEVRIRLKEILSKISPVRPGNSPPKPTVRP